MSLVDEPILNFEQAKRFFIAMGCNHFYVDGHSLQRSDEYRALRISAVLEQQWRREEVERRVAEFPSSEPEELGFAYFSLTDVIGGSDSFDLERLLTLAEDIHAAVPPNQIRLVLDAIIGNSAYVTHGGLIERTCKAKDPDLAHRFVACAQRYIAKAEAHGMPIPWLRSYLVDVIVALGLDDWDVDLHLLREKDDIEISQTYQEGARAGNVFSMHMLAKRQEQGMWSPFPQRIFT